MREISNFSTRGKTRKIPTLRVSCSTLYRINWAFCALDLPALRHISCVTQFSISAMRSALLAAAAAAATFGFAAADTPNHCLWSQVAPASWTLYVSPLGSNGSLVCPQQVNDVPVGAELEVYLDEPDIVRSGPGGEPIGWWSMLYDEGAHIVLNTVPAGMPSPLHFFSFFNWTTDASGNVTSFCNFTNPGNVFNVPAPGVAPDSFGCYFGLQTSQPVQTPITKAALRVPAPVPADVRVREDPEFAARINAAAKGLWTSSARSAFHGMPLSQARKHAGKFRQYRHAETKPRLANGQRLRSSSVAAAPVTVADLPTAWDWRNASGSNFVCPVRSQGNCGSCYSFGSTGSLCARSMIATQGAVNQYWSPQAVVSCSPWTQGCDGEYLLGVLNCFVAVCCGQSLAALPASYYCACLLACPPLSSTCSFSFATCRRLRLRRVPVGPGLRRHSLRVLLPLRLRRLRQRAALRQQVRRRGAVQPRRQPHLRGRLLRRRHGGGHAGGDLRQWPHQHRVRGAALLPALHGRHLRRLQLPVRRDRAHVHPAVGAGQP